MHINFSSFPSTRGLEYLFIKEKEEKPVCAIVIDGQWFKFREMNIDIYFGWREKPCSLYEVPKSYVEKERWPYDDTITIEMAGLVGGFRKECDVIRIGKKVEKIVNFSDEAPYNRINFDEKYGAFIVEESNVFSIPNDVLKIKLRSCGFGNTVIQIQE